MNDGSKLPLKMSNFIRTCMDSDKEFTIKDICEACDLSFDKRVDVQRVYAVIVYWRKTSHTMFDEFTSDALLEKHKTVETVWDAFLNKLNEEGIFLLFSQRNDDGISVYYQPSWVEKEVLDFLRMRRQLHGQITILLEMDAYGEEFPKKQGVILSPKEIAIELMGTLNKAHIRIDETVENKIKELTP